MGDSTDKLWVLAGCSDVLPEEEKCPYGNLGTPKVYQLPHNMRPYMCVPGRGLHSFPFPLNLSLLCPFPLNLSFTLTPISPNFPESFQVELYRERCVLKVVKLSCEVSECKPLVPGKDARCDARALPQCCADNDNTVAPSEAKCCMTTAEARTAEGGGIQTFSFRGLNGIPRHGEH